MAQADTTMKAVQDSPTCIQKASCLPLGGHSVLASLPRLPSNSSQPPAPEADLPVTLVLAGMHSNGLFHDLIEVR